MKTGWLLTSSGTSRLDLRRCSPLRLFMRGEVRLLAADDALERIDRTLALSSLPDFRVDLLRFGGRIV